HARDQLAHEDGFGQVIFDAQLEPANLVLDGLLTGEQYDRDARVLRLLFYPPHEFVPVEAGQTRIAQDQVRREVFDLGQRIVAVGRGGDTVSSLLQADLEDTHAPRVCVHQKKLFLRHRMLPRAEALKAFAQVSSSSANLQSYCEVPSAHGSTMSVVGRGAGRDRFGATVGFGGGVTSGSMGTSASARADSMLTRWRRSGPTVSVSGFRPGGSVATRASAAPTSVAGCATDASCSKPSALAPAT